MADPKKERVFQIVNFAAVLVASVVVGVVVMQVYMDRRQESAPARTAPLSDSPAVAPQATQPVTAQPQTVFEQDINVKIPHPPVQLSQRARVLASEFYCLCEDDCGLILLDCNCSREPGQREMKQFLQALVDQDKTSAEIREAMIAKYGPSVKVP